MIPTLVGRIQTRVALLAAVGLPWTLVAVPLLPRGGAGLVRTYVTAVLTLIVIALLGMAWELLYHAIQQYRWEKDWPILYGLVTVIPEGAFAFVVVDGLVGDGPDPIGFAFHVLTTWVVMWLVVVGPLRIVLLRWRYQGGRVL